MRYIVQNRNFTWCRPESCNDNNWQGYNNGYKSALPVGEYWAFAVSFIPDSGKWSIENWYLTDADEVQVSKTTYGIRYERICRAWRVKFDGKKIRRIK